MKNREEIKIKNILLIVGAFLGFVLGGAVGYMWYAFCAIILGWGDSAPDWYFKIQGTVQTTIMLTSIIIGMLGLQFLYKRAQKKKKTEAQQANQGDGA
jgi:hypothetical protein